MEMEAVATPATWDPSVRWHQHPSPWSIYAPDIPNQPVWSTGDSFTLSPSSIETYLACPRRFFYQTALGLREEGEPSLQTIVGTITHRILEVFNRQPAGTHTHTLKHLVLLAQQGMDETTPWRTLAEWGFTAKDKVLLQTMTALERRHLADHLCRSFENLMQSGYGLQSIAHMESEKPVSATAIPGLQGHVTLKGRIDLLREYPDGHLEIVDYKTSRNDFTSTRTETNMQPLYQALEPMDWEASNVQQQYAKRKVQLPLYWLILQSMPEYAGRRVDVTIQMVRPQGLKGGGCETLTLSHQALVQGRPHLIDMLQKGVIEPLQTRADFPAIGDPVRQCRTCPYERMCDRISEEDSLTEYDNV
jgi:hypothetical protein